MINVTKAFLPPREDYDRYLKEIWQSGWLTNNGPLVNELEKRLKDYLGVKHLFFCSNGTVVLQMALKVMNISKEVLTTPFSYVATTNSLLWEGCNPIFVDIDPKTFCIDVNKIEDAITENTQAILATHVYGIACDVEKINSIAKKYNLQVIYDGAHAFGCKYKDSSLLSFGDITTCSFHATKLFHTIEGGCIITDNDVLAEKLYLFRQFGHIYDDYISIGINAKNSEFHAAMGLCVLDYVDEIISRRKSNVDHYDKKLKDLIDRPLINNMSEYNYSYYPIVFKSSEVLLKVKKVLEEHKIYSRRYFYPSLNNLQFINYQSCPISESISDRVLCLPLYHDLSIEEIDKISEIVISIL